MLLIPNAEGKSPLQTAIERNLEGSLELILNYIMKLGHFGLMEKILQKYPELKKKNINAVLIYLSSSHKKRYMDAFTKELPFACKNIDL